MELTGTTTEARPSAFGMVPGKLPNVTEREGATAADSEGRRRPEPARPGIGPGWLCCDRAHGGQAHDKEIAALEGKQDVVGMT
jgi:hypothetical protein